MSNVYFEYVAMWKNWLPKIELRYVGLGWALQTPHTIYESWIESGITSFVHEWHSTQNVISSSRVKFWKIVSINKKQSVSIVFTMEPEWLMSL